MIGLLLMILTSAMIITFSTAVPVISTLLGTLIVGIGGHRIKKLSKSPKSEIEK